MNTPNVFALWPIFFSICSFLSCDNKSLKNLILVCKGTAQFTDEAKRWLVMRIKLKSITLQVMDIVFMPYGVKVYQLRKMIENSINMPITELHLGINNRPMFINDRGDISIEEYFQKIFLQNTYQVTIIFCFKLSPTPNIRKGANLMTLEELQTPCIQEELKNTNLLDPFTQKPITGTVYKFAGRYFDLQNLGSRNDILEKAHHGDVIQKEYDDKILAIRHRFFPNSTSLIN